MQLSAISLAITRIYGSGSFSPSSLFTSSEPGVWYDPSDLTTMFQDSSGTTPVTADGQPVGKILDKSGRGNHATQATAASRPILIREPITGVRNLLTYSEDFSNAVWTQTNTSVSAGATGSPDAGTNGTKLIPSVSNGVHRIWSYVPVIVGPGYGTGNAVSIYAKAGEYYKIGLCESQNTALSSTIVDLRDGTTVDAVASTGTTVVTSVGNGWYRITWTPVMIVLNNNVFAISVLPNSAGAGYNIWSETWAADGTSGLYIWGAQVETGGASTAYQKVTGGYDVTEAGVVSVRALKFDGVDDSLSTASINWGGANKSLAVSGYACNVSSPRGKIFAAGSTAPGSFGNLFNIDSAEIQCRGNAGAMLTSKALFTPPAISTKKLLSQLTDITAVVASDSLDARVDGQHVSYGDAIPGGGSFVSDVIHIGYDAENLWYLSFNIYSIIIRGAPSTPQEITATETWVNNKTGAY